MGARMSSILRKVEAEETLVSKGDVKPELLTDDAEWELLKTLADYSKQVTRAAENHDPSAITAYLYEISKGFSRFYHDCPILTADNANLARTRLELVRATLIVLKSAMNLVLVPFLDTM